MSEKTEGSDLRVELKRYLGGVPFSHVRKITEEERKAIWKEILPYALVAVLFIAAILVVASIPMVRTSAALRDAFAAILLLVPAYCLYWAWPHLKTLRSGKVFAYIGQMRYIAAFDVVQEHYQKNHEVGEHFDRYIEILATGNGDRIWRLEGIANNGSLRGVRSIQLALIPDHDERGVRPLTREEIKELRLRASGFLQIRGFVAKNLMALFMTLQATRLLTQVVPELFRAGFATAFIMVLVSLFVWAPYIKRWKFAHLLKRDAKDGTVTDGMLRSGLPWAVRGEPARWRLGTAKGGTNGVSREEALALEDDEEELDSELARQAMEAGAAPVESLNENRVR